MNYQEKLSTILNGATIESAKADGDVVIANLTVSQASKLQAIDLAMDFRAFAGTRVTVAIDKEALNQAFGANKKAPRASSAVTVDVATRTVYNVRSDGDNQISSAWLDKVNFDDQPINGGATINGANYTLYLGEAADYYDISEDADPTRTVYCIDVPIDGVVHTVTSYGLTNLLRSLARMAKIG